MDIRRFFLNSYIHYKKIFRNIRRFSTFKEKVDDVFSNLELTINLHVYINMSALSSFYKGTSK